MAHDIRNKNKHLARFLRERESLEKQREQLLNSLQKEGFDHPNTKKLYGDLLGQYKECFASVGNVKKKLVQMHGMTGVDNGRTFAQARKERDPRNMYLEESRIRIRRAGGDKKRLYKADQLAREQWSQNQRDLFRQEFLKQGTLY